MNTDDRHHRIDGCDPPWANSQNHHSSARERLREMSLPQIDLSACPPENRSNLLREMNAREFMLTIGNDLRLVPLLIDSLSQRFVEYGICDRRIAGRLGVALGEAVVNAIVHGNLEVDSAIRDEPENLYDKTIEARRLDPRFRKRRVRLHCFFNDHQGRITVRDEGPGFDVTALPDPTVDENLSRPYGRGILLIRAFFDEVDYSDEGNSVSLLKRRAESAASNGVPTSSVAIS